MNGGEQNKEGEEIPSSRVIKLYASLRLNQVYIVFDK